MTDEIVIQNDISKEGMRTLHVMLSAPLRLAGASAQIEVHDLGGQQIPPGAEVKEWEDEIRLHHLTATWKAREAIYYIFEQEGNGKKHPMVVWALEPGQRISEGAVDAALVFCGTFGYWPSAAWVRMWPKGLNKEDAFMDLGEGFGMDLFAVQWAIDGFVIVGGGFYQKRS